MKKRKFLAILTYFVLHTISCAQMQYDQNDLVGSWHYLNISNNKELNSTLACVVTFNPNGRLKGNCIHEMKGIKPIAIYRFKDESEWFIRGDSYFDKTIRMELVSIEGDEGLVDEIKNDFPKNESDKWNKWEIVKLTKNEFIIKHMNAKGKEIKMKLIKIF
jgi:hypothetical protein